LQRNARVILNTATTVLLGWICLRSSLVPLCTTRL